MPIGIREKDARTGEGPEAKNKKPHSLSGVGLTVFGETEIFGRDDWI